MNEGNKKIITILSVFTIIFTLVGGTLAYWTWTSDAANQTGVAFTIEKDFSCSADGGQNINSTNIQLQPTSDCTNSNYALQRTIKVTPDIKRDNLTISLDMWLTVNSLGEHLSNSNFLRYAITTNSSSCTDGVISKGNFKGMTVGDKINLLSGKEYTGMNLPQDTYYLYIWLDEKEFNNNTQNQSFNFSLGGECTDSQSLSYEIMSLSNVSNSNVYKESYYKEEIVTTEINKIEVPYTIIPAKESEWVSVTQSGDTSFVVNNESNGLWSAPVTCLGDIDEDLLCDDRSSSTIIFKTLNAGYYDISYAATGDSANINVYVNNKGVASGDCKINGCMFGPDYQDMGDGYGELGYINVNDEIKIVVGASTEGDTDDMIFRLRYREKEYKEYKEYIIIDEVNLNTWRYEGETVDNNYINFNNETWRILGVEEGGTIGLERGKYYTKIVRDEYLPNIWQDDVITITGIYESYYANEINEDIPVDYTEIGLKENSKKFIVNANWKRPIIDNITTPLNTYIAERTIGITIRSGIYVGAMTPSDYGLSALQSECGSVDLKNFSSCKSWLFKSEEALMSKYHETCGDEDDYCDGRLRINSSGSIDVYDGGNSIANRPIVYLNHNVVITGGSGKIDDKYEIALG